MNNFYGILKIEKISDVEFEYYNKCKLCYYIICVDIDNKKDNSKFILKCEESLIDGIYSKLKVDNYIFILGKVANNPSYNVYVKFIEFVL